MYEDISRELNRDYRRIDAMMRGKGVYTEETTGKQYFTGYAYKTLYDRDQYIESVVQLYLDRLDDDYYERMKKYLNYRLTDRYP